MVVGGGGFVASTPSDSRRWAVLLSSRIVPSVFVSGVRFSSGTFGTGLSRSRFPRIKKRLYLVSLLLFPSFLLHFFFF